MVALAAVFPLGTGILAGMLAAMSAVAPGKRTQARLYFTLFNVTIAVWSLTYAAELALGHYSDPAVTPWGVMPDSLLLVLTAFSVSATPAYWFLFAAADSHLRFWLHGRGLFLAYVPVLYTVIVGITNPWHRLFLTTDPSGKIVGGPLVVPYYAFTYAFMIGGTWILIRHSLAAGTAAGRGQAVAVGLGVLAVLLGGVAYGVDSAIGHPLPVNPTPSLFALLGLVLAYEILRTGLGSIVPISTLSSIMENTDAPLAYLDPGFTFVSVNSAFIERSGHIEAELLGHNYFAVFPEPTHRLVFEAVKRTGEPAERKADTSILLDRVPRRLTFWNWSLSAVKSQQSEVEGLVLSLVDVTDEVLERDLGRALESLTTRLHAGFASDTLLCRAVADAGEDLGCESSTLLLRDGGWRMIQGCERPGVGWEPFDEEVYPHLARAVARQKPVVIEDARNDDRFTPSLMDALGVRAALVVPLMFEHEPVGAIAFIDRQSPGQFSHVQVEFAQRLAASLSAAVENRRVYESERRIAETLQESMLSMPEAVPGIDFAHCYRSATEAARVGGDFYDLFEIGDGKVAVLIGDIAGHGIEAAVATSLVKNTIRAHALDDPSPAHVMDRTNEIVRRQMETGVFATACFSVLDRETGRLSYCNAGHPPTLVKTQAGEVFELAEHSTVLGVVPNVDYPQGEAVLSQGDVLVLYTDGVIEARRDGGLFGEERLVELLASEPADDEPVRVVDRIYKDVMSFTGNDLSDDIALLAVRLDSSGA